MHLFFDTVWKLHIGEIPEKPNPKNYLYPGPLVSDLKQYEHAIAAIKQNALTVWNPEIIKKEVSIREWYHDNQPVPDRFYFWPWGYETKETPENRDGRLVAILTLPEEKHGFCENPDSKCTMNYCDENGCIERKRNLVDANLTPAQEEKKNTMENMTKEQANLVRLINEGLSVIRQKKMEYLACSADGNPNWEYFKGKADAYEYAHKTFKRILEWTASGSVAAPKEERTCPKCGSGKIIMFNSDDDLCQTCGATFPGVLNGSSELASLRQQLKEREEALKEFAQILLDYKHSGVEVNIDYLLDKFPYENIKGKI